MNIEELRQLSDSGELLLDLGEQPVSNRFLHDAGCSAPRFPFRLRLRRDTGLVHLEQPFPVEELRPRYPWLTCFEPEPHLDEMVQKIIKLPGITQDSVFGAYSFKDDSTLRRLEALGYGRTWRLDPAGDLGVNDPCANVETYQAVLSLELAAQAAERHGLADVLIVRHVVEHANDLPRFMDAMHAMVKPEGYVVWELPDCERALVAGDCTTLWEEHVYYFTSFTFRRVLEQYGAEVVHFESVPYPFENSLVAFVKGGRDPRTPASSSREVQEEVARAERFAHVVAQRRKRVQEVLAKFKQEQGSIVMFGAGHLSVAFLSIMEVTGLISAVIDDNPHKKGMVMPIGGLPILGSEALYQGGHKLCLLSLNPQNQPKVIDKHQAFESAGGRFASIFPGTDREMLEVIV